MFTRVKRQEASRRIKDKGGQDGEGFSFGILHYILKGSEKRMQQDVVGRISVAPSDIADFSSLSGIKNPNRSLVDFLSDAARGLIRPTVLC